MKNIFLIIFISIYCTGQDIAKDADTTNERIVSSSVILKSAGAIATTALLIHYDQKIYENAHELKVRNKFLSDINSVVVYLGDGKVSLGIFGGFIGYGLIFENKKAVEVGKIGCESFLFVGTVSQLIKLCTGRERPKVATRPGGFWYGPLGFFRQPAGAGKGLDYFTSFPSNHVSTAFSTATVISDFYSDKWIAYTCYSLATLVAISRVTEGYHWLSDCFAGAIIGYLGVRVIEKINYGTTDISIRPWSHLDQQGISICLKIN